MKKQEPIKLKFSGIPNALTFKWGDEPEIVHFIRTGFTSVHTYHVVEENGYETKPDGKDFLMDANEIQKKFGIDIKAEFQSRFSGDDVDLEEEAVKLRIAHMSHDDVMESIGKSLIKVGDMYQIDYSNESINMMLHMDAKRFYDMLLSYAKHNNVCIITAKQEDDGKAQS